MCKFKKKNSKVLQHLSSCLYVNVPIPSILENQVFFHPCSKTIFLPSIVHIISNIILKNVVETSICTMFSVKKPDRKYPMFAEIRTCLSN